MKRTPTDAPQTSEAFLARSGDRPVTVKMLLDTVDVFMDVLKQHKEAIVAQKARIEHLESRPLQKWAGIHVAGAQYAEASLCTHHGSLWVATDATTTTPGEPGGDWRLIVKRGRA